MKKALELYRKFTSLEGSLFRYALSFGLLLGILPCLSILVMLYELSLINLKALLQFIYLYVPSDLIEPFINFLLEESSGSIISSIFSFGVSIWIGSQSLYAFLLIHAKEENIQISGWLIRLRSILLFLLFILSLCIAGTIVIITKINLAILFLPLIYLFLLLFYRFTSFNKNSIKSSFLASSIVFFALLITGIIFFIIIQNLPSYNKMYGPLSSIAILFLAVYAVSSLIYLGCCISWIFDSK